MSELDFLRKVFLEVEGEADPEEPPELEFLRPSVEFFLLTSPLLPPEEVIEEAEEEEEEEGDEGPESLGEGLLERWGLSKVSTGSSLFLFCLSFSACSLSVPLCWSSCLSASDLSGEGGCDDPALLFFFSFFCFFDDDEEEEDGEGDEGDECKSDTDFVFVNSEGSGSIVTSCIFFL